MDDVGEVLAIESYADEVARTEHLVFGAPPAVVQPLLLVGFGYPGMDLSGTTREVLQEREDSVEESQGPEVDDDTARGGKLSKSVAEVLEGHSRVFLIHCSG